MKTILIAFTTLWSLIVYSQSSIIKISSPFRSYIDIGLEAYEAQFEMFDPNTWIVNKSPDIKVYRNEYDMLAGQNALDKKSFKDIYNLGDTIYASNQKDYIIRYADQTLNYDYIELGYHIPNHDFMAKQLEYYRIYERSRPNQDMYIVQKNVADTSSDVMFSFVRQYHVYTSPDIIKNLFDLKAINNRMQTESIQVAPFLRREYSENSSFLSLKQHYESIINKSTKNILNTKKFLVKQRWTWYKNGILKIEDLEYTAYYTLVENGREIENKKFLIIRPKKNNAF